MDLTAPAVAENERFDSATKLDQVASQLATLIQNGKHFIVYTGAGVSTSAGIPDFRGPEGAWTKRAQGKELNFDGNKTLRAMPTATHMALVALQEKGLLKYVVSQNCDGLHRRSGIQPVSCIPNNFYSEGRPTVEDYAELSASRIVYRNCTAIATENTVRNAGRTISAV